MTHSKAGAVTAKADKLIRFGRASAIFRRREHRNLFVRHRNKILTQNRRAYKSQPMAVETICRLTQDECGRKVDL